MDSITVPLTALSKAIKQMRSDDMDYVEIMLMDAEPADDPNDEPEPACIHFSAFQAHDPSFYTEYDDCDIPAVDVDKL